MNANAELIADLAADRIVGLPEAVGFLSTRARNEFYQDLSQPDFKPLLRISSCRANDLWEEMSYLALAICALAGIGLSFLPG